MTAHRFRAGDYVRLPGSGNASAYVVANDGVELHFQAYHARPPSEVELLRPADDAWHRGVLKVHIRRHAASVEAARANLAALEGGDS